MNCFLCLSKSHELHTDLMPSRRYFRCPVCALVFLDPAQRLTVDEERSRYLLHENDIENLEYQKFVSPLLEKIKSIAASGCHGLDFGSGTGPVLGTLLERWGFVMQYYDPFFAPDPTVLTRKYDFVCASEVVEHFYNPSQEFQLLKSLLKPGGVLGIMTSLLPKVQKFEQWYYRKDPTHVCFYSSETFHWIKNKFNFKSLEITNDKIITLA